MYEEMQAHLEKEWRRIYPEDAARIDALATEQHALRKDAARYRLLRIDHDGEMLPDIALYSGRALDDYIDAALASAPAVVAA